MRLLPLVFIITAALGLAAPRIAAAATPVTDTKKIIALAESGSPAAQYQIGLMLQQGKGGVTQDPKKAAAWFRRAAEQGNRQAQYDLAVMLLQDRTLPGGYTAAYFWLCVLGRGGDEEVVSLRDQLAQMLPPEQAAPLQRKAENWKPVFEALTPKPAAEKKR
jgi:uncharacterized protein